MSPYRARRWYITSLIALVIARFMFISHDDIVAQPYDEAAYIGQAAAWYWKNHYIHWTYSRQPGYPLFLAVGSLLGIPARLVIEGVWIGATLLLVHVVGLAGVGRLGRSILVALLLFHPITTNLFRHALSENLYTCLLLIMLAALAAANTRTNRREMARWSVRAGLAAAVAGVTRQETVLIYALVGCCGLLTIKSWVLRTLPRQLAARRLLIACAMPLAMVFATEHVVRLANLVRIGAYVTYDWSLPGFKDLYRTMLSITPEHPDPRVPIPREVREKAAKASPTYSRLLEIMTKDDRCATYIRVGEKTTGVPGEPGSYNLWLMREAAWILHNDAFRDARETDEFYRTITRELRSAQDRGELPRRWTPLAFIPPDWGQLAVAIPRSFPACWRCMTEVGFVRGADSPDLPAEDVARFDAVAQRRAAARRTDHTAILYRNGAVARLDDWKRSIASTLPWLSVLAMGLSVLGAACAQRLRRTLPAAWYWLSALLWAAFVLRLLLVATLDATGVVASTRYMFPSAAILMPLGVLGAHAIAIFVRTLRTHRSNGTEAKAGETVLLATPT